MKEPPDPQLEYFKSVKVSLKHVLKHYIRNQPKINERAMMAHKIVIHTLQFMKMYLIHYFDTHKALPKIDKVFVNCCMKILCNETSTGRPPKQEIRDLKATLKEFYKTYYQPLQHETLDYQHMNTVLDYLTIDIVTMYENNIKLHYVEYVERYVNVMWEKKIMIQKIRKIKKTKKEKDSVVRKLNCQLRKIKNDILNIENQDFKSNPIYHTWIQDHKKRVLPDKSHYTKNNLYYDLQCNPQDYFSPMVLMMKEIEKERQMAL